MPVEDDVQPTGVDAAQLDAVFEALYGRMRRLAARIRGGHAAISPTTLVHEAYLRLRKRPPALDAQNYDQAVRIFANAMQQILIDAWRRQQAQKRTPVEIGSSHELPIEEVLTLMNGLDQLESENERQAQVVRARFVLQLTTDETAAALGIGPRTVERELLAAKARLAAIVGATR